MILSKQYLYSRSNMLKYLNTATRKQNCIVYHISPFVHKELWYFYCVCWLKMLSCIAVAYMCKKKSRIFHFRASHYLCLAVFVNLFHSIPFCKTNVVVYIRHHIFYVHVCYKMCHVIAFVLTC